jgi:hypothetical protein
LPSRCFFSSIRKGYGRILTPGGFLKELPGSAIGLCCRLPQTLRLSECAKRPGGGYSEIGFRWRRKVYQQKS